MLTATLMLASLVVSPTHSRTPKWFDATLAGYAFAYDSKHETLGVHDPRTGFYLVRSVECDGADLDLVLTRDRHVVQQFGYRVAGLKPRTDYESRTKLVDKPLPSLSTGKGIRVGDTPGLVRQKLGKPSNIHHTGARKQFLEFDYTFRGDREFHETYTFKTESLIEIRFSWLPLDPPGD